VSRPYDLVDYVAINAGLRVTWQDDDAAQHTADVSLEYQPAERDCGINAGWVADGDAPEWVLEWAAEWADADARDAADYASERRAEARMEAL
jgi:hypothetical protein